MQHVALYGGSKLHFVEYNRKRAIKLCAASVLEMARRYCPRAVTFAEALVTSTLDAIDKVFLDHAIGSMYFLEAMQGRIVETRYHYVINGTIFVAAEIIAINIARRQLEMSCERNLWYSLRGLHSYIISDQTASYVDEIKGALHALMQPFGSRDSYLSQVCRDIRGIIAEYLDATRFIA